MKKIFQSLGFLSMVSAPVVTIVSCGPAALTEEQQKFLDKLKSSSGINMIKRMWMEKLVSDYLVEDDTYFPEVFIPEGKKTTDAVVKISEDSDETMPLFYKKNNEYIIDKIALSKIAHVKRAFEFFVSEKQNKSTDGKYFNNMIKPLSKEKEFNLRFEFKKDPVTKEPLPNQYRQCGTSNFAVIGFEDSTRKRNWLDWLESTTSEDFVINLEYTKGTKKEDVIFDWKPDDGWGASGVLDENKKGKITLTGTEQKLEWVMSTLFNSDELGLVNDIYQMLLTQQMYSLNREDWKKVFYEEYKEKHSGSIASGNDYTNIHEMIDPNENFYLTMKVVEARLALEWNIKSNNLEKKGDIYEEYGEQGDIKQGTGEREVEDIVAEMDMHLVNIAPDPETEENKVQHLNGKVPRLMYIINKSNAGDIFIEMENYKKINTRGIKGEKHPNDSAKEFWGYKGFVKLPSGGKNLDFSSTDTWKKIETNDVLEGYFSKIDNTKGKIITKDEKGATLGLSLKGTKNGSLDKVEIKRYSPAIPLYEEIEVNGSNVKKLTYSKESKWKNETHILAWNLYMSNSDDVYKDLVKYNTHEEGKNFFVTINSEYIVNMLKNQKGLKIVKYKA